MSAAPDDPRIAGFLARYTPEIAARLAAARARLRAHFPRGVELVFDNYNALVFAIATGERATDAFISVAGYPRWVTLFFGDGSSLDDPAGVLDGEGKTIRSVRLADATRIDAPEVIALIAQVAERRREALQAAPPLATIVKTVAAKTRPRRPA